MSIALIKYNAGNTFSVLNALERIGVFPVLTDNPEEILNAEKVIFPGVGEASSAMEYLKSRELDKVITSLKVPVLGICIGLQLMCQHSEENNTDCMSLMNVKVKKFPQKSGKIPQIGWNTIENFKSELFKDIPNESYVYYVHSFAAEISPYTIAESNYGLKYSAALKKDNFYAVQFHTEKSGKVGEKILENFIKYC